MLSFKALLIKVAGGIAAVAVLGTALAGAASADTGPAPARQPTGDNQTILICFLKPNLVLERLSVQTVNGQRVGRIAFKNAGCATGSGFYITVLVDATPVYLWQPAMGAFQSAERTVNIPALPAGTHSFHAALDWHMDMQQSLIAESNEYDNFNSINFTLS